MKKLLKSLSLLIFCILFFLSYNPTYAYASPPEIQGEGMVLMDYITGDILAEKNAHKLMAPASTTKIMTALLTLENCKLQDIVKVGPNPPLADGSSIGLKEGDQYTVEELLYALLLESANDSALTLAEHIGGTEENFAKMMNEKAKAIGAKDTHFVNSSGLFEDNHLTTPYDLALIMREISKIPDFSKISKELSHEMPISKVDNESKWVNNRNLLLSPSSSYYYKPIICSKTGYTTKSNHTFIACAEKNGQKLVLALFNYENKHKYYDDTKKLLDYGFETFKTIKLYNKDDVVGQYELDKENSIPLILTDDIYYVANKTTLENTDDIVKLRNKLNANFNIKPNITIQRGQTIEKSKEIFNGDLILNNQVYKTLPLLSGKNITYSTWDKLIINIQSNYKSYLICTITLSLIIILFILYINKRRKNSKKYFS